MWEQQFTTAEEALQTLSECRSQCARLTRKLEHLQVKSTATTGRLSAAGVRTGGQGRSELWDTLADTRADLTRQLQDALALEQQIGSWIDRLPHPNWRMVLRYRYLDAMNCQEIADELEQVNRRPYSRSHIFRLQRQALQSANRLWPLKHTDAS